MASRPATYPLSLYRGDSYNWQFKIWADEAKTQPVDLTGATAKAEIRDSPGGTNKVTFTCSITVPNTIVVNLPATAWTGYVVSTQTANWDLQVTLPGGSVITYVAGPVVVTQDVTDSIAPTGRLR